MNPFALPPELVSNAANQLVKQLAFLAAVGGLSAAIVKAIEDFSWCKCTLNRNFIQAWMLQRIARADDRQGRKREPRIYGLVQVRLPKARESTPEHPVSAWTQMLELCSAGDETALTGLDVDQICGQLNGAAQIAVQFPSRYRSLLEVLASGASPSDLERISEPDEALEVKRRVDARKSEKLAIEPRDQALLDQYQGARTRMSNYVQRSVDALHVRLESRWQWWVNLAGLFFSALIVGFIMWQKAVRPDALSFLRLVIASIAGGFLAPIARNLAAAIKGWAE